MNTIQSESRASSENIP